MISFTFDTACGVNDTDLGAVSTFGVVVVAISGSPWESVGFPTHYIPIPSRRFPADSNDVTPLDDAANRDDSEPPVTWQSDDSSRDGRPATVLCPGLPQL